MNKKQTVPPKDKPKRPLNFYFRLRAERLIALKDKGNPTALFAEEWKDIPEAVKEAEKAKDKIEQDKYRAELKAWELANPNAEKPMTRREKKEANGEDSDDDKKIGQKSRGKPTTKATKDKDAEEVEKVEKGKSKPKGNEKNKGKVEEKPKAEEKPKVEDKSKKNKK